MKKWIVLIVASLVGASTVQAQVAPRRPALSAPQKSLTQRRSIMTSASIKAGASIPELGAVRLVLSSKDMNGNGNENVGWSNADRITDANPAITSGFQSGEIGSNGGTGFQFISNCGEGWPCIRGAVSGENMEMDSAEDVDWIGAAADTAFECHMYVKATTVNAATLHALWGTATGSSASRGSNVFWDNRGGSNGTDRVKYRRYSGGATIDAPDNEVAPDTWHLVSVVDTGTGVGDSATLYIDGVSAGVDSVTTGTVDGSASPLHILSVAGSFDIGADLALFACYDNNPASPNYSGGSNFTDSVMTYVEHHFPVSP